MSGLIFKLEKPISGQTSTGSANFPKPFHAFKAKITEVIADKGWINVKLEGVDYKAGQYDALGQKIDSE